MCLGDPRYAKLLLIRNKDVNVCVRNELDLVQNQGKQVTKKKVKVK